ncbi:MAG: cyclic nucleotide-binding domain-containing protein [Sinobacteraceae bacterium]|nr:cyclic nucleotide-binding domain-containing protein [Nevskiaceae bacterium]
MAQQILGNLYLFSRLADEDLAKVEAIARDQHFAAGQRIFSQGDDANAFYVIKNGSIQIRHTGKNDNADTIVRTLGSGSHFGEMAFIESEKRSAGVTALEDSDLVVVEYSQLNKLLEAEPLIAVEVYRSLACYLSGRVRQTTTDLGFARDIGSR